MRASRKRPNPFGCFTSTAIATIDFFLRLPASDAFLLAAEVGFRPPDVAGEPLTASNVPLAA
jgi:hypothetical protein